MRRSLAAAALILAGLGLAACGVPLSSGPSRLPQSAVPAGLLTETPAPQLSCSKVPKSGVKTVYIYLVQAFSGSLVKVTRCVPTTHALSVQDVLKVLENGPIGPEYQADYTSYFNINSDLVSVGPRPTGVGHCPPVHKRTAGTSTSTSTSSASTTTTTTTLPLTECGLATVRLDPYFSQLTGEQPIDELAQIVFSLTQSPLHVTEVRFLGLSGKPVAVETADGRFVNRPVTVADYRHLGI